MNISLFAHELVHLAKVQGRLLTTAESCTGGLISAAITEVSGASDIFYEGYVTYSNLSKIKLLGVTEACLAEYGAVSLEVAHAMAEGALKAAQADLSLSVTGIAGPTGGTDQKPVGTVCFGLGFKTMDGDFKSMSHIHRFENLGRAYIREQSVLFALKWALDHLKTEP
jgi:nicotinamide-nucleotide amidase